MEKLKKQSFLLLLGLLCVGSLQASTSKTSETQYGPIQNSSVFPALSSTTDIAAFLSVSTGPSVVYAINLGSVTTAWSNYVIFYDTTAPFNGVQFATITAVGFSGGGGGVQEFNSRLIHFDPPIRFSKGITTRSTGCGSPTPAGVCYTVYYDRLSK